MTEREINEVLRRRGVLEFVPSAGLAERIGVSASAVKSAMITGALRRVKRGTVARADLAMWLAGRQDVLAQLLNAKRPETGDGELYVVGWRGDVNVTIAVS